MNKMQFNQEFSDQILAMTKIANKSSTIIFSAESGLLTVVIDGNEVCVRRRFMVDTAVQFRFAMKMNELEALLGAFTYGTIKVEDSRLTLTSGNTRLTRATTPADEIYEPEFPKEISNETEITADVFELATYVAYAAAKTDAKPSAERIAITVKNNQLRAYALDGYRFAVVEAPCQTAGDGQEYLLRPSLIAGLNTLIKKEKLETISISSTAAKYLLKLGEFEITVSQVASSGMYHVIESVREERKAANIASATFSRGELLRYLQRINLVADKSENRSMALSLDPQTKGAYASYKSATGSVDDIFDATYENLQSVFQFAMKPDFLSDACQKIQGNKFTMQLTTPLQPILLQESCDGMVFVHCILPVRFDPATVSFPDNKATADTEPVAQVPTRLTVQQGELTDGDVDDSALVS